MADKYDLSCSIVLYKNDPQVLKKTIESVLNSSLKIKLYLVDNSPSPDLKALCNDRRMQYIFSNENIGFGKAHNVAIKQAFEQSDYHLVLNPDVYFELGSLEALFRFMEQSPEVGLLMPKVFSSDHQLQYLCKRLPTPDVLILRRFFPFLLRSLKQKLNFYEMHDKDYSSIFESPSLSGCFMFVRSSVFKQVGLFDERFFMYMEDADFSRRVHKHFKTVYYPEVSIFHGHARGSYKLNKLLFIHICSAFKYFNKWGWFFDKDRTRINRTL